MSLLRGCSPIRTAGACRRAVLPARARGNRRQPLCSAPSSPDTKAFRLHDSFVSAYRDQKPPFGFNGLGELVYRRSYSRKLDNQRNEEWYETVERVVNGTFSMQSRWMRQNSLGTDCDAMQDRAQEMFDSIFHMRFLPPGRGLWAMGSPLTEQKGVYAALNNCAFVSTQDLARDPAEPFTFLMDASMLGVGVGFDTRGAGSISISGYDRSVAPREIVVSDSREGWVASVRALLEALFGGGPPIHFDYSQIRPAGTPIAGFGGVASGPGALQRLHEQIEERVAHEEGKPISITLIVDLMNFIGKCVVAGNVRQTAEIAFGDPTSTEYIDLKNYDKNPHRADYGWTSNNSVFAELGMNYSDIAARIVRNGEPGIAWLENMRQYGRMIDPKGDCDPRAMGGNPCLEQTLESFEMCCLVETFPTRHTNVSDFLDTLSLAHEYAKTVTLAHTHWNRSNAVMLQNRRIGCSMSGLAQFVEDRGVGELQRWCDMGYRHIREQDRFLSSKFCIPESIKLTSIKPSGTVSLLAGCTPGVHYPESSHYIRRVRLSQHSPLLPPLRRAGYDVQGCVHDPQGTAVVSFPVSVGDTMRTLRDISLWEQLSLASLLQRYWADNQVSCTVTFDPETEAAILPRALDYFQYHLKGVSFLPRIDAGAYAQMPYEGISREKYQSMLSALDAVDFSHTSHERELEDRFCDADSQKCTF